MITHVDIQQAGNTKFFNAALPAIHFKMELAAVCVGNNSAIEYIHADIIAEGSSLVHARRNEQSKPLRDILRSAGLS